MGESALVMQDLKIRLAKKEDTSCLIKWLQEPGVLQWFPMTTDAEIEDSVKLWMSYIEQDAVLTAEWQGKPVGSANLYLQSFEKLSHHSLLAIIVTESMRGKGIGKALIEELIKRGKEKFHLKFLHLEVYEGNPAKRLYERLGFQEIGVHKNFIKDQGKYFSKIFMQKYL